MARVIEIEALETNFYTYEGVVRALDRVSLAVNHGCTFGLVGESGCGKSVTVRSVMRIIQAPGQIDGGKLWFSPDPERPSERVELLGRSEEFMRGVRGEKISMIFQEPNAALNPIMSIGEQVGESFLFHRREEMCRKILAELNSPACRTLPPLRAILKWLYGIGAVNSAARPLRILGRIPLARRWDRRLRREALRRSIAIIGKLGIPNPEAIAGRYPHQLSGGMKQRIVIAIALACNPVLLIADEATSNLDVTIQAQILELLRELKEREISSILLITHDLGIVAEYCDAVGVMYAGQLCEVAGVGDLFASPRHPYTQALIDSVPRLSREGPLKSIEGNVPNLVAPPPGCRFHPRCPHVMAACRRTFPRWIEVAPGHSVACHLWTAS